MRRKTPLDVERDIYLLVKSSPLFAGMNVLREGVRPLGSPSGDVVVAHNAGLDGQTQEGVVNVNCYVADKDNGAGPVKDIGACSEIAGRCQEFIETAVLEDYDMRLESAIRTYRVKDAEQHCVNMRIEYRRTSIND